MNFTDIRNAVERNHREGYGYRFEESLARAFYKAFGMEDPRHRRKRPEFNEDEHRDTIRMMANRTSATDRYLV